MRWDDATMKQIARIQFELRDVDELRKMSSKLRPSNLSRAEASDIITDIMEGRMNEVRMVLSAH